MYIDKEFTKFTNTQLDALKTAPQKRYIGEKLWFLYEYCKLTEREPELKVLVEDIIKNNVEFSYYTRKIKSEKGYCYSWEGTYYVSTISITDQQSSEIKTWYRRIRNRKDSVVVDDITSNNNTI